MRNRVGVAILFALMAAAGCGPVSQAQLDQAKALVAEGLEAWKKGGKPSDLKALAKPVVFDELLWEKGDALVAYETKRVAYHAPDRVIRCHATLTLRGLDRKERTLDVVYDVRFRESPVIVSHNPMP